MIAFTVYGVAQPKGNMRAFQRPGMRGPVLTDANRSVKSWQQLVAEAASAALDRLPLEERLVVSGGVRCEIFYFLPRPQALNTPRYRGVEVAHIKRPDIDKLTRAVLDALTAVLWVNDAQVVELVAVKRYAAIGLPARVDVRVQPSTLCAPLFHATPAADTVPLDLSLDLHNPQEAK